MNDDSEIRKLAEAMRASWNKSQPVTLEAYGRERLRIARELQRLRKPARKPFRLPLSSFLDSRLTAADS